MKKNYQIQLTIFLLSIYLLAIGCQADNLVLVTEIFRHGAREPLNNNTGSDQYLWNWGQLTNIGMRQHYTLGQTLKNQYIDTVQFLDKSFNHQQIYINCTDYNRTLMSAISQLQGMFPQGTGPIIDNQTLIDMAIPPWPGADTYKPTSTNAAIPLQYQQFPIHTTTNDKQQVLLGFEKEACPNVPTWVNNNLNSPEFQQLTNEEQPTIQSFSKATNTPLEQVNLKMIHDFMDTWISYYYASPLRPNPYTANITDDLVRNMTYIFIMYDYMTKFKTTNQLQTVSTPFFHQILANIENRINNILPTKWYMYSAHDTTVGMIMNIMNFTSWSCMRQARNGQHINQQTCITTPPGYASNVIFELWSSGYNQYYIMVKLNGTYQNICNAQSTKCTYATFKMLLKNYMVESYEKNCGLNVEYNFTYNTDTNYIYWPITFVVILILAVIVMTYYLIRIWRQYKKVFCYTTNENNPKEKLHISTNQD